MSERIFVYGTLKRGLSNHRFMAGQRFLGEATTAPVYRMVDCGGFPGMFSVEKDGLGIRGEVWEVDDACRKQLDVLEDVEEGMYALRPAALLPPFATGDVCTYVYEWPTAGKRDVGEEWREDGA
jgi:gamma-glutamylaminecyclotransferase